MQLPKQSVVISNPSRGEVYSIQHYVIKFVSDFTPGTLVSSTNRHNITEILLKATLNTITNPTKYVLYQASVLTLLTLFEGNI
jgi:hypothetical protein